jgi:hypothetical protein
MSIVVRDALPIVSLANFLRVFAARRVHAKDIWRVEPCPMH